MHKLLKVEEAAELYLNCSIANVYSLMDEGKLPYVNVGVKKGRRIRIEDLEKFIEENRVHGVEEEVLKHL